jgi:CBS domain containing-hemolysin-like protein
VEDYDNIAEFLLAQFNHVPQVGESYILNDCLDIMVLDSDERSIKQVKVRQIDSDE